MSAVAETRQMRELLESDLYREVEPSDPDQWASAFESPLKWRVEWAITRRTKATPGPGARVRCHIVDPRGQEYATSEDATVDWLGGVLP